MVPADLPALVESEPHSHTAFSALLPQSFLLVLGAQVWFGQPPGKDGAAGAMTAEEEAPTGCANTFRMKSGVPKWGRRPASVPPVTKQRAAPTHPCPLLQDHSDLVTGRAT